MKNLSVHKLIEIDKNFKKKSSFHYEDVFLNKKILLRSPNHYEYYFSFYFKKNFFRINKKKKIRFSFKKNTLKNFIQILFVHGLKIKFLKYFNEMHKNFYFFFRKRSESMQKKFTNYNIFYNFSKMEIRFFNFNFLLNLMIKNSEAIFYTQATKKDKKIKKKTKSKIKYLLEIKYLKKEKRSLSVLKQINLLSGGYNFYFYGDRLLASIFNTFFLGKNSEVYKHKISVYSAIIKKNIK